MAVRPIRIGIIGAGTTGLLHAKAYHGDPRAEIFSICDVDAQRGGALADRFKAAYVPSYEEMLRMPIDAVSICLPPARHRDAVLAAAANGKHILLEKPIADSLEAADDIVNACAVAGVRLMLGFTHRYHALMQAAQARVAAGEIGEVRMVTDTLSFGRDVAVPGWSWNRAIAGGGVAMCDGVHSFDRIRWFVGDEVESICGGAANLTHPEADVEDSAAAYIRFQNGAFGVVLYNWTTFSQGWTCDLVLYGTRGKLKIETWDSFEISTDRGTEIERFPVDDFWGREIAEFLDSIIEGREPRTTGEDGVRSLRCVHALYRSAELGSPVRVERG